MAHGLHKKMLDLIKDRKTDPKYIEDFVLGHIEKAKPRVLRYMDEDTF